MRLLGLVPARGGSKGIPRKNLAPLGGKPLLAWTVEAACGSRALDRVVLSTDDPEIAEAGRRFGAEVPFLRPPALANDTAPALAVIRHALAELEGGEGWRPDAVLYLQPTSPFRGADRIAEAAALIAAGDCETVVSVVVVPHNFTPGSLMREEEGRLVALLPQEQGRLRRQEKPRLFARNGPAILALSRQHALGSDDLYGGRTKKLEMGAIESIDIDEPPDLAMAAALLPLLQR